MALLLLSYVKTHKRNASNKDNDNTRFQLFTFSRVYVRPSSHQKQRQESNRPYSRILSPHKNKMDELDFFTLPRLLPPVYATAGTTVSDPVTPTSPPRHTWASAAALRAP